MPRLLDALERKQAGCNMRQADVAAVLGVHAATIRQWRRGFGMNGAVALRLAVWLDIDLRDYGRQDPLPVTQRAA